MSGGPATLAASLLLLCALPAAAPAADEVEWRTLRSEVAGFEAEVPGEPSYEYSLEWTIAGRMAYHHYQVARPRAHFDIERMDLPVIGLWFLSDESVLNRVRDDLMFEVGGHLDDEERFEVRGHPARRLRFRRPEAHSRSEESRLYLVGRYLYIVTAGPYEDAVRGLLVDPFFASFRFCIDELAPCEESSAPNAD